MKFDQRNKNAEAIFYKMQKTKKSFKHINTLNLAYKCHRYNIKID